MPNLRPLLRTMLAACLCLTPAVMPDAAATGAEAQYVSSGTVAVRADGSTVVDEGALTCADTDDVKAGVGGFCLPFGGGDAVAVNDTLAGQNVAFQVCVDNSGDGVCTSPDTGTCADVVEFSHDDAGNFFNPVGPLPTGFTPGCGIGAYQGYVVFVCEGVHTAGTAAHAHPSGGGFGYVTSDGEGLGTFCGGSGPAPTRKPYRHAEEPTTCRMVGFAQELLTGSTFEAVAEGSVTAAELGAPPGSALSIRCRLDVDGLEVASTPTGTGTDAAATTGRLAYIAFLNSRVELCAEVSVAGNVFDRDCAIVVPRELPNPAERDIVDTSDDEVHAVGDGALCPVLQNAAGSYGVVTVNAEGDVSVGNPAPVYDCPPFGTAPPSGNVPQVLVVSTAGFGIF